MWEEDGLPVPPLPPPGVAELEVPDSTIFCVFVVFAVSHTKLKPNHGGGHFLFYISSRKRKSLKIGFGQNGREGGRKEGVVELRPARLREREIEQIL